MKGMKLMDRKTYECKAIRLCIDGKDGYRIYGSMYSPYLKETVVFSDLATVLVQLEDLLDYRNFPKTMFQHRSFLEKKEKRKDLEVKIQRSSEEIEKKYGECDTFLVYVNSRRNAGIQGHFVSTKNGKILKYESELQFLHLIEEQIHFQEDRKMYQVL